jgi:hypothetical protein
LAEGEIKRGEEEENPSPNALAEEETQRGENPIEPINNKKKIP